MSDSIHPPNELVKKIKEKVAETAAKGMTAPELLVLGGAIAIIRHFLGTPFVERYISPSLEPDPYMLNSFDDGTPQRFTYQDRVVRLADYLFRLQNERGFDVLIERFTTNRDMRSVNLEAMIADHYKQRGFSIEILSLTGIRGQDFDFRAIRESETINVEVTGFTNDKFSLSNVKNVLHGKRNQLPDTHPAFLYCIVPPQWSDRYPDIGFGLQRATYEFFARSRTKRINAVIYVTTYVRKQGIGVLFAEMHAPVFNPQPRFTIDTSFLGPDADSGRRVKIWKAVSKNPQMKVPFELENLSYWSIIFPPSAPFAG